MQQKNGASVCLCLCMCECVRVCWWGSMRQDPLCCKTTAKDKEKQHIRVYVANLYDAEGTGS